MNWLRSDSNKCSFWEANPTTSPFLENERSHLCSILEDIGSFCYRGSSLRHICVEQKFEQLASRERHVGVIAIFQYLFEPRSTTINGGEGGIRTLDELSPYALSKRAPSASRTPLLSDLRVSVRAAN